IYSGVENLELSGWFYDVDTISSIAYADGVYSKELENLSYEIGLQFANFGELDVSLVDGSVYGAMASLSFNNLTLSGAYNSSSNDDGKFAINGFGGGPYFTSMDEMTIDGINDAKAYMIGLGYNLSSIMPHDVAIDLAYGVFEDGDNLQETKEMDIVLSGNLTNELSMEVIYANIEDDKDSLNDDLNFDRVVARVNYSF
ncbi:MAG: hypothetical protein HXX81_00150, partial [Campylobacterales bacterium]|nr:hypothetical protein [Campylobacterales bacterium]